MKMPSVLDSSKLAYHVSRNVFFLCMHAQTRMCILCSPYFSDVLGRSIIHSSTIPSCMDGNTVPPSGWCCCFQWSKVKRVRDSPFVISIIYSMHQQAMIHSSSSQHKIRYVSHHVDARLSSWAHCSWIMISRSPPYLGLLFGLSCFSLWGNTKIHLIDWRAKAWLMSLGAFIPLYVSCKSLLHQPDLSHQPVT